MKRIFLFMMTNVLVMVTISVIMNIFGISHYIDSNYGINYEALIIFCALWGMGGAFISLLMSKSMAKMFTGTKIINPKKATGTNKQLLDKVYTFSRRASLPKMPEVGIYDSPEINAFATGPSKRNSLVAVSTGLLNQMNDNEIDGVLAHEVAHIANGDMVTMTLIQGIVNAFAMFLSRIVAWAVTNFLRDEDGDFSYLTNWILTIIFDILFTILGSIIVAWFSRHREYRADEGSARIGGKQNMIDALQALKSTMNQQQKLQQSNNAIASLKISGKQGILGLFATHPSLDDRIKNLRSIR